MFPKMNLGISDRQRCTRKRAQLRIRDSSNQQNERTKRLIFLVDFSAAGSIPSFSFASLVVAAVWFTLDDRFILAMFLVGSRSSRKLRGNCEASFRSGQPSCRGERDASSLRPGLSQIGESSLVLEAEREGGRSQRQPPCVSLDSLFVEQRTEPGRISKRRNACPSGSRRSNRLSTTVIPQASRDPRPRARRIVDCVR